MIYPPEGLLDATDSACGSAGNFAGSTADMALQPKLGLLSEQRAGHHRPDSGGSFVIGQDLNPEDWPPRRQNWRGGADSMPATNGIQT